MEYCLDCGIEIESDITNPLRLCTNCEAERQIDEGPDEDPYWASEIEANKFCEFIANKERDQ